MPATLQDFEDVFPKLIPDLEQECTLPSRTLEWFTKSLCYNTLGGKCNRGLSVIDTAAILLGRPLSEQEFFDTAALGWMIELFQAFMLVTDDIMDASKTRRRQPCWYLVPGIGMIAINDACMLESSIYIILKKKFRQHPLYVEMMELLHEVSYKTEVGQSCDMITAPEDADITTYTMEQYLFIVAHKTAYYSFYLPIALALMYTEKSTAGNLRAAREISLEMGEYFQVQDDYLDAFADPAVLGKIGTDIQDNKCSWLILQAMAKCTPYQLSSLQSIYGRKDPVCEMRVKILYRHLALDLVYEAYEADKVARIEEMIQGVDESDGLRQEVFHAFLSKIHKRVK
ncbi:Farnesyl pyrophosphate synthetase [Elasticomyces elasticus]|nr:Farnesyl pyrophosphate synthetase [Elasticomyces elasticus]